MQGVTLEFIKVMLYAMRFLLAREFDSCIIKKYLAGLINPAFFMSNILFYFIVLYSIIF